MTRHDALTRWWAELDDAGRDAALLLEPGRRLPGPLAEGLRRYGVPVPSVSIAWDVDGRQEVATVHVQPREVADFLSGVRRDGGRPGAGGAGGARTHDRGIMSSLL